MKILLNGATGGTNFGDFLFAKIFHDTVSGLVGEENVFWYESRYCLSEFYKRHLNYSSRKFKLKEMDALVCISGGYFCGDDRKLRHYVIRYFRYFHLCFRCILRKIPIAIIGVEVSKPKIKIMEWIERAILRRADIVVVRNIDSLNQLENYGVKNGICTVDTAHVITPQLFDNCKISEEISSLTGKKIFFHVQPSMQSVAWKLIPTVKQFVNEHPEYSIVVGMDQYLENDSCLQKIADAFCGINVVINHYDDPVCLCKVLNAMDLIITPKLHVGIVGAILSKSVISFSSHTEKIARFYHQLGEEERSLSMMDFSEKKALEMLEKYHDVPINVDQNMVEKAQKNLECLGTFIRKHSKKDEA